MGYNGAYKSTGQETTEKLKKSLMSQGLLVPAEALIQRFETSLLLPTGGEEREVMGVESIPAAILLSCQHMNIIALQLHNMNIVG